MEEWVNKSSAYSRKLHKALSHPWKGSIHGSINIYFSAGHPHIPLNFGSISIAVLNNKMDSFCYVYSFHVFLFFSSSNSHPISFFILDIVKNVTRIMDVCLSYFHTDFISCSCTLRRLESVKYSWL